MKEKIKTSLLELYKSWSGREATEIELLPLSGSNRQYFRIFDNDETAIGVYNPDKKENNAFLTLSRHFTSIDLKVPEIYNEDIEKDIYLIKDLGDITLFSFLTSKRGDHDFPEELTGIYKNVLKQLPKFQIQGGKGIDYNICYPRHAFDKQSMMWDLSYFKYYFLKLAGIPFDEQALEDDFTKLTDYLLSTDCNHFLYRDFQSRNIMIHEDNLYFIDYQGGRKGALQYDLASLLYDAKAEIPNSVRQELLDFYIEELSAYVKIDSKSFTEYFYGYVFIRIMQALGAYGFRGFYEKKEHFLQSIPYALDNLKYLLENVQLPVEAPTLFGLLEKLTKSEHLYVLGKSKLKVTINSFSYKKGIPTDTSGNGGGFVFDCRALPNPGRLKEYSELTGKDRETVEFLKGKKEVSAFLEFVFSLVDQSVENYIKRNFKNLTVNFGCTGGQHRSVYCTEKLAKHLNLSYDVIVDVYHKEIE